MFGKVITTFRDSVEVAITAKNAPATFPTVTDDIDNLAAGLPLAPGSTLLETSTGNVWIMNDKTTWDQLA